MPAWYDIRQTDLRRENDEPGVRESARERPETHRRGAINIDGVTDVAPRMESIGDGWRPGHGLDVIQYSSVLLGEVRHGK